ncbi:MAG: helix-turn-helix transcriptional regulator [bacterium]|nr:helix-turn-helix transcriptional regulator [bacterium]
MKYKMTIKKLLGKKIKNLRVKRGLTQEKLAEMVGISQRSLSGIEIGENFLTAETLDKILNCLKISIEDLFAVEHLKPANDLTEELLDEIAALKDEEKIKTIYRVVKAILKD